MSESDRDALVKLMDSLVYHGRVIERYEHPALRPLSEQDFRIYDESRKQISLIKQRISDISATADAGMERAVEIPLEPSLVIPAQQIVDWSAHLKKKITCLRPTVFLPSGLFTQRTPSAQPAHRMQGSSLNVSG